MTTDKNQRYIKIGEDGALLAADAADAAEWVAVLDTKANLMWAVEFAKKKTFKAAQKYPGTLAVAGFKDWRLPTVEELFYLVDRTKYNPAIDTDFFPKTPSYWFWSSTVDASAPADCAWIVNFGSGHSNYYNQGNESLVRAVRAGQIA